MTTRKNELRKTSVRRVREVQQLRSSANGKARQTAGCACSCARNCGSCYSGCGSKIA
jgi:hypothetical protein